MPVESRTHTVRCLACRAANDPSEERCVRCGRRLHPAAARPAPASLSAIPGGRGEEPGEGYQPSLFREVLAGTKVVPIPTLTPLRAPGAREPRAPRRPAGRGVRRLDDAQQRLEFHESGEPDLPPNEEIVCDAPVAAPAHRILAAAVDAAMVGVALGLFLAVFWMAGGELVLNRRTAPLLAGIVCLAALLYRFLWCIANGDTPGMRFAGLRLVDFDGRPPSLRRRGIRLAAALLSVVSGGLGLVWALVDEENLGWHDHISKTFPTAG
jgi:uncharacterized RDD family membrane protein YckC